MTTSIPRQFSGTSFSKSHIGAALSEAMARASAANLPFANEPEDPPAGEYVIWATKNTGDPMSDGILMVKWADVLGSGSRSSLRVMRRRRRRIFTPVFPGLWFGSERDIDRRSRGGLLWFKSA